MAVDRSASELQEVDPNDPKALGTQHAVLRYIELDAVDRDTPMMRAVFPQGMPFRKIAVAGRRFKNTHEVFVLEFSPDPLHQVRRGWIELEVQVHDVSPLRVRKHLPRGDGAPLGLMNTGFGAMPG